MFVTLTELKKDDQTGFFIAIDWFCSLMICSSVLNFDGWYMYSVELLNNPSRLWMTCISWTLALVWLFGWNHCGNTSPTIVSVGFLNQNIIENKIINKLTGFLRVSASETTAGLCERLSFLRFKINWLIYYNNTKSVCQIFCNNLQKFAKPQPKAVFFIFYCNLLQYIARNCKKVLKCLQCFVWW